MAHQRINFEWRIGESEYDFWRQRHPDSEAEGAGALFAARELSNREQQLVNYLLRGLTLLMVAVVAAAGLSYSPRQMEWERAEAGILASLDRENRAWYNLDRDQFLNTVDPNIDPQWVNDWRRHWRGDPGNRLDYSTELRAVEPLGNGVVRVTVGTRQPAVEWSQVENLQEIRYYREMPQGWVRTVPSPHSDYWGEQHTLQIDDLQFIYHTRDEEAVLYAAPKVAAAIAELYGLLDISAPPGYESFVIELIPDRMGRWAWTGNHLQITSPTLTTIPDGLTHGEQLAGSLLNRLSYRILHESPEPGGRFLFRWTVLNWGLRRWMNSHLLEQWSPWHEQAATVLHSESMSRLPLSPLEISDNEQVGRPSRDYVIWRFMAAETIIDYGVATYGEETLPSLFRAFVRYPSWTEMVPNVYGVDLETFTAGWNEYLAVNYGIE